MDTEWNADLYLRFEKERTQPSHDLINRIDITQPQKIVDIGCGPGNSTAVLRQKWNTAEIVGIDNSKQMIQRATDSFPEGNWVLSDAFTYNRKAEFDIVFSNAVIQWIPNHETLIPHLLSLLKPKGIIAIQVPQNHESPLHQALTQTAIEVPFCEYTNKVKDTLNYNSAPYYYELLNRGVSDLYIWETIYYHLMKSHLELLNWYKSTGMRPFLNSLPTDSLRKRMMERVLEKCIDAYKLQSDGMILFPFKRLFLLGYT